MKRATWRVGLYSKVVLTVIAVSLVGLLVRQLPEKVEAKPERYYPQVSVLTFEAGGLRSDLEIYLEKDNESAREGKPTLLNSADRAVVQKVLDFRYATIKQLLRQLLGYMYTIGYRVKFMTDDFIILEAE